MTSFKPIDALLGGLFIGTASGMYMLVAKRIAGNSGALKSLVLGPRDTKTAYILGLAFAGAVMRHALPSTAFDMPSKATLAQFLWGVCIGVGVFLANGCTSGHGLCGLSRLSFRSLVAVPVFMLFAIIASTVNSYASSILGGSKNVIVHRPAPVEMSDGRTLMVAAVSFGVLALTLYPAVWLRRVRGSDSAFSIWCGACAGVGLSIGGMVRPSIVQSALSPQRLNFSLWLLFVTALVTTFGLYRIASRVYRIEEACAKSRGEVDATLVGGAALFGIGWGATGFCPGPLIVYVAAFPTGMDSLMCLLGIVIGMFIGASVSEEVPRVRERILSIYLSITLRKGRHGSMRESLTPVSLDVAVQGQATVSVETAVQERVAADVSIAPVETLQGAMEAGALVVDLRRPVAADTVNGAYTAIDGALSAPWDRQAGEMPTGSLPRDKAAPIVLVCASGKRASKAAAYLAAQGHTDVLNAGGPQGPVPQWNAIISARGLPPAQLSGFEQLFDDAGGSSTLTYILGDEASKEAIIIDPVDVQADRDLDAVEALGYKLVLALNTHCHADHITGTGLLKARVPGLRSCISAASGAEADMLLVDGQAVSWAGGARKLLVLSTPGHTNGCLSYYDAHASAVFTGDALLISGCGRTDFQEGDAGTLYDSVHTRLFTLPKHTLVLPGHDYKGRRFSTIGAEKRANPRLTQSKEAFIELMANLKLLYPKKIDASLPANLVCGIQV